MRKTQTDKEHKADQSRIEADFPTCDELVRALSRPEAYATVLPEVNGPIAFVQTHISMLFMVGSGAVGRVFKVKKPVDMGFLDYTDLQSRRHYCHEEVRLNRRLAPDVYLGVRSIVRDADGSLQVGMESETNAVDYAVEMIRLPADRMLNELLERDEVDALIITGIAALLAHFHAACDTGDGVNEYATHDALQRQVSETITQISQFKWLLSGRSYKVVQAWFDRFISNNYELFQQRIHDGRIREGHGDVHAENICVLQDRIVIYDCIEFSRRFRCRDVACEIAFLAMDLDARGHRTLARELCDDYADRTGDRELIRVIPFYKAYLALVRAKVFALKSIGSEIHPTDQTLAQTRANHYALLATSYIVEPVLVFTCGLPGSGKSWAARALARSLNADVLRSDVIRKQLIGLKPHENASKVRPDAYSAPLTRQTYAAMLEQAKNSLNQGRSVIADATFATAALRQPFLALAQAAGVPWLVVQTVAPDDEIRKRMQIRAADAGEVSDADYQVYEQARERWREPTEVPDDRRVVIGPAVGAEALVSRALDALLLQSRSA